MKIVVTDTNVFVLFYQCNLLTKLLSSSAIEINIPEKIYEEMTRNGFRIKREYSGLSVQIQQARHGNSKVNKMKIVVKNVLTELNSIDALGALFKLKAANDLDAGEIEAIPLAIELQTDFISNDAGAIKELNTIYAGLGAVGKNIEQFLIELEIAKIITKVELKQLTEKLKE